ncbi:ANK [Mytilus coruscus]|uniref:ANK n=1 Tax=Mytilus coruscus TaxID=42192 RepID=A0A6J7ZX03_MYTCO|nr:ANK [Mytilus coruscus]
MASAVPVLSRKESNFLRVANLLIRLSPKAVRILFDREFNPSGLKSTFSKNWTKLDKLKKKRVITQPQWSLLFPSGSDPKSIDFDLTLIVCLLRYLTKITIQDQLPQPSDLTEEAAVSRIKFYRNQIAHSDSGAMSDSDFNTIFAAVSKAIETLCPTMKSDCITLQNADLDCSFHEIYVEFVKKEKQLEELTAQVETLNLEIQNIQSIQTEELSEWKKKLEKFYVTEAATRLVKVIQKNQCTIITGIPGSGKSALAYHVAIHIQETEGYTVLPNWVPSELMKMANSNIKQLFVFDDVFGKYSLNECNLNCWESETRRINMLLKNKLLKFIKNEVENFKSRKDISFIALALLVLSNNSIQKEGLQIGTDKYESMLHDLCDEMNTRTSPSKTSILTNLQSLKNMYLAEKDCIFCTKHDKIFDIISHTVGKFVLRCILSHGEATFISSRCQLISLNEQHDECTIMITDELETMYFERLFRDIENGHNWEVFASIQMKFLNYRKLLMQYLEKMSPKYASSINDFTTPLHVTAAKGYFDISNYLLEKNREDISSLDDYNRSPLHQAAINGHHEIIQLFLKNGASIDQLDNEGYTPLLHSCGYGYSKVVQELITNHSSINICGNDGWYPIHMAASDGNSDLIKILVKHKAKVNMQMINGMTPLYIACNYGNLLAVKVLHESKADVNKCENNKWSPLNLACLDGCKEIAEELILNGADVNQYNDRKETPLYSACKRYHIDIVKLLLEHGSDVDIASRNGMTPISLACDINFDCLKVVLLHQKADDNKSEQFGSIPLKIACIKGNADIVNYLLEHDVSINQSDENGYTPLHLACEYGKKHIAEILIKKEQKSQKLTGLKTTHYF